MTSRSDADLTHRIVENYSTTVTVGTKTHGGRTRPIRRTRQFARCSCGWTIARADFIDARRLWKEHRGSL